MIFENNPSFCLFSDFVQEIEPEVSLSCSQQGILELHFYPHEFSSATYHFIEDYFYYYLSAYTNFSHMFSLLRVIQLKLLLLIFAASPALHAVSNTLRK
jgi:hypothetical protein